MDHETSSPIEVDTNEAFDRDVSDLDIPGYEDSPQPAANEGEEPEAAKTTAEEPAPEEVDEKAKAIAEAKASATTTAAAPKSKVVAFKAGDGKAIELLEDAVVDWKVDGKSTPVPLKDLLTNYSGKVAWEKRFNEVAEQRKQFAEVSRSFEATKARHSAAINDMHKAASEGRTFDAVTAMLKLTDTKASPREYIANLRNGLIKQAEEMAKLTPEQRQLFEEREEVAYLKSEGLQAQQQREQEQAEKQFYNRVVNAISSVNSTTDEYLQTRDWLLSEGPKIEGSKWNPSLVTPEYVATQIRDVRDYRTAKEALDAVDPALVKNETVWKQAVEFLRSNKDWTAEDLKEVYGLATKEKRAQAISKKVAKAPVATTATASAAGKPKQKRASREDFTSFDAADLDW